MASPRPDVVDLLDVPVAPGGTVIAISDLHLPPRATTSPAAAPRCWPAADPGKAKDLTVVLAGDIVEMLANPETNANTILEAHPDLCRRWPASPSVAARSFTRWATMTGTWPGT